MKCDRWVTYQIKHLKSGDKLVPFYFGSRKDDPARQVVLSRRSGAEWTSEELCGGEILCNVHIEATPGWGDTYYSLGVEYRCAKCGWAYDFDPRLPHDEESLSNLLRLAVRDIVPQEAGITK